MNRPADWELRLNRVLRASVDRPYHVREWNCARFAHACAEAVSGRSIPFKFKNSLAESVDSVLIRSCPLLAKRGDIVLAHVPEPSLGVCIGREAVFVTNEKLLQVPMQKISIAWAI